MSSRVWASSIVVAAAILAVWLAAMHASRAIPALRSEHSDPAAVVTSSQEVAVTPAGKLFHKPACPFIHGKAVMMPEKQAIAEGYTPDPRCLKSDLARPK